MKEVKKIPDPARVILRKIIVTSDSPPFNNGESLTITVENGLYEVSYSGLTVQGQRDSWQIAKPFKREITFEEYSRVLDIIFRDTSWITANEGRYDSGNCYSVKLIWETENGERQYLEVKSVDYRDWRKIPTSFWTIIREIGTMFIGHDLIEASTFRYD